ncbi:LysR family transcriptional regulator [Actinomycetes bacterium KLBMP 9759]
MELREIETFLVLADELHFGRSATRLRLSQGRVSQTIQSLEREIGGSLFDRSSRHVRLTRLGEQFRKGAQRIVDEVSATLRTCQALTRDAGWRIHVGYSTSVGLGFVAELTAAFEAAHPESVVVFNSVGIRVGNSAESLILDQKIDIALMWCPGGDGRTLRGPHITIGPTLAVDRRAVLVPSGHPLGARAQIELDDLVGYTLIEPGARMVPAFRELWAPHVTATGRRLAYTDDDMATMVGRPDILVTDLYPLVLAGRGLHFTVASVLDRVPCPGIVAVPVVDMPPAVLVPIWRAPTDNAGIRAFVEVATSMNPAD